MNSTALYNDMTLSSESTEQPHNAVTNLAQAAVNQEYLIKGVVAGDEELEGFLFTLGCFKGETVTLISIVSESYVISIKDARYSIGSDLAEAILI